MSALTKPLTPIESRRVRAMSAEYYGPFFVGHYQASRNLWLIMARNERDEYMRAMHVAAAKDRHREYLRCLREAKREGRIS